jgi:hypothetical protein
VGVTESLSVVLCCRSRMGSFTSAPKILNEDTQDGDVELPPRMSREELLQYCHQQRGDLPALVKRSYKRLHGQFGNAPDGVRVLQWNVLSRGTLPPSCPSCRVILYLVTVTWRLYRVILYAFTVTWRLYRVILYAFSHMAFIQGDSVRVYSHIEFIQGDSVRVYRCIEFIECDSRKCLHCHGLLTGIVAFQFAAKPCLVLITCACCSGMSSLKVRVGCCGAVTGGGGMAGQSKL